MTLDELLTQIEIEISRLADDVSPASNSYRIQAALSVVSRVPVLLSSAVYSELTSEGVRLQGLGNHLAVGAGICGHHVQLATWLFDALAVPSRDIQVFYMDDDVPRNHTFVEVKWGSRWRMVDVTWGFIPHNGDLTEALSYEEAVERGTAEGFHHTGIPWRRLAEKEVNIFGYLTNNRDAFYVNGHGSACVEIAEGPSRFPHQGTNLIGNLPHASDMDGSRSVNLRAPYGVWDIAMAMHAQVPGTVHTRHESIAIPEGRSDLRLEVRGPRTVHVDFAPAKDPDSGDYLSGSAEILELVSRRREPRLLDILRRVSLSAR